MRRTNGYEYITRINGYWILNVYLDNKLYLPGTSTLHHLLLCNWFRTNNDEEDQWIRIIIISIIGYWIPNVYLVKKTHFGQEDNNGLMDMNILLGFMDTEYLMFT